MGNQAEAKGGSLAGGFTMTVHQLPLTIITKKGTVVLTEEGVGVRMPKGKLTPPTIGWGEAASLISVLALSKQQTAVC